MLNAVLGFMSAHWFISLVYVVVGFYIAARFFKLRVRYSKLFEKIFEPCIRFREHAREKADGKYVDDDPSSAWMLLGKGATCVIALLVCTTLLLLTVSWPAVWVGEICLAKVDREKETLLEEKQKEKVRKLNSMNSDRAKLRAEWIAEHRPKLHFCTISGITAVLTPAAYKRATEDKLWKQLDGEWEHEVLLPSRETFLFVTREGRQQLSQVESEGWRASGYISGNLSTLKQIVAMSNYAVTLEPKQDIFVPFVNESLLTFEEQHRALGGPVGDATYERLVESQAPADLQELKYLPVESS